MDLQADDDTSHFPVKKLQRKEWSAKRRAVREACAREFDPVFKACFDNALGQLQPDEGGPVDDAVVELAMEAAAGVMAAAAEEEEGSGVDEDDEEGWAPGRVLPFIGYEFKRFDESFL